MKCSKCGKEIANDSLFCEYCGTEIRNDNANKKDKIKRVDIRWALLFAMFIATIAMGFASESVRLTQSQNFAETVVPVFLISLSIFVVSCWCAIRKLVSPSFIVVMGLLFSINCLALVDGVNINNNYARSEMRVNWFNRSDGVTKSGKVYVCYWGSEGGALEGLVQEASELREVLLKADGETKVEWDDYDIQSSYCYGLNGMYAFVYSFCIVFVYLIYAFIAHKRAWRF